MPPANFSKLPGEWTLAVCDGGENYYGWDWETNTWNNQTDPVNGRQTVDHSWIPCACGYQGNETALFYNQSGITTLSSDDQYKIYDNCQLTMSYNNNQGFLNLNGGMPANNIIKMSPGHTLTMTPTSATPSPLIAGHPWFV